MVDPQTLASVEQLLGQMRAVARQAQGLKTPLADTGKTESPSFAAELKRSLDKVSDTQNAAFSQAQAFTAGDPDVSLTQVMIDLQKANLSFQATVQVRNRLIEAYKEIANMAI